MRGGGEARPWGADYSGKMAPINFAGPKVAAVL